MEKGAPLGKPCRHGGFPHRLCRLAEHLGSSMERAEAPSGSQGPSPGALLRITRIPWLQKCPGCLECPLKGQGWIRSLSIIQTLPVLAQLHTCVPYVSSSLRPVPHVPSYIQPCSARQGLRPCNLQMAKSSLVASVPRPQALATFQAQPVPTCGCGCMAPSSA